MCNVGFCISLRAFQQITALMPRASPSNLQALCGNLLECPHACAKPYTLSRYCSDEILILSPILPPCTTNVHLGAELYATATWWWNWEVRWFWTILSSRQSCQHKSHKYLRLNQCCAGISKTCFSCIWVWPQWMLHVPRTQILLDTCTTMVWTWHISSESSNKVSVSTYT